MAMSPAARAVTDFGLPVEPAGRKLKILFLGGTGFLGPATVQYALDRGHEVTLFNRQSRPDMFPDCEKLKGDRDPKVGDGLTAIEELVNGGRRWDVVIDTPGQFPRIVGASAQLASSCADMYLYISSISAFADHSIVNQDESGEVATMEDETVESFGASFENYGPLKALCEKAAENAMPGKTCNIRPGLIVGPRDWSDRFTYWPYRVSLGGEILAPHSPDDITQYIDVRDLGKFMITCCESRTMGLFTVTGPTAPTNMGELLYGCKAVTGGDASFTWVDSEFLQEHGVGPWMGMPVWVPSDSESGGLLNCNISKAIAAGLTTRPLADTVRDTLDWFHTRPEEEKARLGPDAVAPTAENAQDESIVKRSVGVSAKKEAEVLAAWHARA